MKSCKILTLSLSLLLLDHTMKAMDTLSFASHYEVEPALSSQDLYSEFGFLQEEKVEHYTTSDIAHTTQIMNQWWQINHENFQDKEESYQSNQLIALLNLLHNLQDVSQQTLHQAILQENNELHAHDTSLSNQIQTFFACKEYIENIIIVPVNENKTLKKPLNSSLNSLPQMIKLKFNTYHLDQIEQINVIQLLDQYYSSYTQTKQYPLFKIENTLSNMDKELTTPITQTEPRNLVPFKSGILQNKQKKYTWNEIFRNDHDDEKMLQKKIDQLIADSYISLDMQYAVLSLCNKAVIINAKTGKIKDIPTIETILNKIDSLYPQQKKLILNALDAAYNATQIALFIASTEQLYSQEYYFTPAPNNQNFINELKRKKQLIEKSLAKINPRWDQYLWQTIFTADHQVAPSVPQDKPQVSYSSDDLVLTQSQVEVLLNNTNIHNAHDYTKLRYSAQLQADLLFEQCFIAQQHHLYFSEFQNLQITAPTYRPEFAITVPHIINHIKTLIKNSKSNPDLFKIHQLLLDTRLAVQTALDIATRRSTYIGSSLLNPLYVRDPLVIQLQSYDKEVEKLITDKNFGATEYDYFFNPLRDYVTLSLIKGTYFAGALLTLYVSTYLTYQHANNVLTLAYLPFKYSMQAIQAVLSLTHQIINLPTTAWVSLQDWYDTTIISPNAEEKIEPQDHKNINSDTSLPSTPLQPAEENLKVHVDPEMVQRNLLNIQESIQPS